MVKYPRSTVAATESQDGMAAFPSEWLRRYKHPESFKAVAASLPRDDSGKVRRTLLRDQRASWLRQGRAFRAFPSRPQAKAG